MSQGTNTVGVASAIETELGPLDELAWLGAGTFGTTYKARRGDDTFAVKVIHGHADYLWDRETAALQRVTHENVVGFRGTGRLVAEREHVYLICEFIGGGNVRERLDAGQGPADPGSLRDFAEGLLQGIAALHSAGVLHRDLKPENIALRDGFASPVILDLGMAKVDLMSSHTQLGQFRGTAGYAAPEQLLGDECSARSDLFSLAVVVYELGTGQHPFLGRPVGSVQELHARIMDDPTPDPRHVAPNLWDDRLADLIMRLLSGPQHRRLTVARALADLASSRA